MRSRPGGTDPPSDRAWRAHQGLGSRRVRIVAFGAAFALHVIAFLLYPSVIRSLRPEGVAFPSASSSGAFSGPVALRLIEIDETLDLDSPEQPEEIEEIEEPEADADAPVIVGIPIGELVPPAPSAAQRLRPNLTDARLWAEPPPEFYELTLEEREELLLSSRIVEWYDSVALVRAAEDRLTDWTFRDSNGGRWGIADGKIYLGDVALPLPLSFGTPVGRRDETARRVWEFEEIARQSQRYLIEESWKERAAAIRARRDRERATAKPDTTRGR